MASTGNIKRRIQLITGVIDYKMLKGKYLVGMLFAHPLSLKLAVPFTNSSVQWYVRKYVETNPNRYLLKW